MSRKRNKNTEAPKMEVFSVEEVLDKVEEANLVNVAVVGRDKDDRIALYGTIPTISFLHHQFNSGIFQLGVMEHAQVQAQTEVPVAEEVAEVE